VPYNSSDAVRKLNEEYEDALFRLILNVAAEKEGRLIYEENIKSKERQENLPPQESLKRFTSLLGAKLKSAKRNHRNPGRILRRTAVAVMAVIIMCSVMMVSVDAFRLKVLNLLISIEPKYTSIQISNSDDKENRGGLIVDWKNAYVPTYIPAGYKAERVSSSATVKTINFKKEDDNSTLIYTEYSTSYGIAIDTENASIIKAIEIGGREGTLSVKDSVTSVAWIMDDRLFVIQGQAETNEIIKMAEDVKFLK